jgi:hypothetical protein
MATRGTLYRCHLCSFLFGGDGPQTPGLDVTWTRGLQPIGGSTVMAGSLVELYGRIDDPGPRLAPDSRVRFDILEEDYLLTGGLDDRIDSLVGTNATAPEEGFRALSRQTEFVTLGSNETVGDFVDYLRRNRAPEYRDRIFLLEEPAEPPVFHVLAFWEARQQDDGDSDFYFVLNIDDNVDDKTEHILTVTAEPLQESAPGASLGEQPDAIEIDLTVLSEAAAQVEAEFATEQEAGRTGWQPPDFGSEIADTVDPAVANARRLVRAVQPPPPDPMSIDSGRDPWPFQHPQAAVNLDEVKPGPSPFEGNAIAIMRSWDTFRATGDRYAISFDFNRAIRWGQLLFGARAFVVIEGPLVSDTPSRYFTVRTNLLFALAANQFQSTAAGALGFVGVDVRYWQIEQRDAAGNLYMVRLIGTIDNAIVIPNYPAHRDETCAQLLGGCPFDSKRLEPVIPPERAIQEVYGPIDAALRENRRDDAAKLLI